MLGTIEELEKEIEQFQKNMNASGELMTLLSQMLDEIRAQNDSFDQRAQALISKVDSLPVTIEEANSASNQRVKEDVSAELTQALKYFSNEQKRYLTGLEQNNQQLQKCMDRSEAQERSFNEKISSYLEKLDSAIRQIQSDNVSANNDVKIAVDKMLESRYTELASEQQKYLSSIEQVEQTIKSAEEKLGKTYGEFIDTLVKMNISNLCEQNQQLKNELTKRTTILTIISVIGVLLGIIGFFI